MESFDLSDSFEGDTSFEEPKKNPPVPTKDVPVVSIVPIASKPYQPFTNFYISITKATNLHSCTMSSLYLCIRIKNTIRPILTNQAWCNNSEATFNCAYALDFSGVNDFALNSFSPVIELHERYGKKSVFVGFIVCPLQVTKVVTAMGKPLSFIYFDKKCEIRDIRTSNIVGNLNVTIALGEKEHATILDPNSPTFLTFQEEPKVAPKRFVAKKKVKKVVKKAAKKTTKRNKRKRNDYYSDYDSYSYSDDNFNWEEEALKAGWTRPGQKFDWKSKAKQAGWTPPSQVPMYSTETACNFDETDRRNVEIQVLDDPFVGEISSICPHESQIFDDNDIQGLVAALNVMPTGKNMEYSIQEEEDFKERTDKGVQNISPINKKDKLSLNNFGPVDLSSSDANEDFKDEKKSSVILSATEKPLVLIEEEEEEKFEPEPKHQLFAEEESNFDLPLNSEIQEEEESDEDFPVKEKEMNSTKETKTKNSTESRESTQEKPKKDSAKNRIVFAEEESLLEKQTSDKRTNSAKARKENLFSDEESENDELLKELAKQTNSSLSALKVLSFLEEEDEENNEPKIVLSPEIPRVSKPTNLLLSDSDSSDDNKKDLQSEEESFLLGDRKNIKKKQEEESSSDSEFEQVLDSIMQQNKKQSSFIDQIEEEDSDEDDSILSKKEILTKKSNSGTKKVSSSIDDLINENDEIDAKFRSSSSKKSAKKSILSIDNISDISDSDLCFSDDI